MKRILFAFTFLFFVFSIYSQESIFLDEDQSKKDTAYIISGLRINSYSSPFNDIQSLLETNNFARLEDYSYSFEWYLNTVRSNKGWEGNTSFGFYQRKTSNRQASNQASIIGLTSNFETMYNLTKGKMFNVKPFLGVGIEYYKLSFVENLQSSSLSSIASSDFKNYNATSFQVPWTLGLEIGTSFQIRNTLIDINLRGGYKFHFETDAWKIDDVTEISDEINLSSPFVGFSFGFSFYENRRR